MKRDINGRSFVHLNLMLLLHYLVKCRSRSLDVYIDEFMLGTACRSENHCETRKSLKICYFFNINQESIVPRSRTSTNCNDAWSASGPFWVTRLLNVIMSSGIGVYALVFVLERTFWTHIL